MKFTNPKTREQQLQDEVAKDWAALEAATAPETVEVMAQAAVKAEAAPAPAPAVALTQEQFAALLGAIGAQAKGSGDGVADALSQVIKNSRKPSPENEVHHGISHYRPDGQPAPAFRWPEVWRAAVDEKGDTHPLHPFHWERSTLAEIEAINSLIPGVRGKVEFTDGSMQDVAVIEERTVGGDVKRLLLAFNFGVWKDRTKYNSIGKIPALCAQLRELADVAA